MWPYEKRTEDIILQFSFLLSLNSSSRKRIFYIIFPLERLLDEPRETNIKKAKKHNAYTLHDGNRVVIIISCRSITRVSCYSGIRPCLLCHHLNHPYCLVAGLSGEKQLYLNADCAISAYAVEGKKLWSSQILSLRWSLIDVVSSPIHLFFPLYLAGFAHINCFIFFLPELTDHFFLQLSF